jgi:hypothetical protein
MTETTRASIQPNEHCGLHRTPIVTSLRGFILDPGTGFEIQVCSPQLLQYQLLKASFGPISEVRKPSA